MKIIRTLTALLIVAGIPAGLMIWYRSHQTSGFASIELIVYPLLFGGLGICVLLLLKRYFLEEPLRDFNSAPGTIGSDILWGLALTAIYFLLFYIERHTLSGLLAFRPNMELLGLMLDMREHPWMMLVWFGPVLWIGIALYEELVRAFLVILEEPGLGGRCNRHCRRAGRSHALEPGSLRNRHHRPQEFRHRCFLLLTSSLASAGAFARTL
jgi:hypothetical protein